MLGIGVGLYIVLILYLAFTPDLTNYFSRTDFDSERWKKWEDTENAMSLRWDMVDHLQANYELRGMTEQEILALLDEPDPESKSDVQWLYDLGSARRGMDYGTLSLILENGKVKSYKVWSG